MNKTIIQAIVILLLPMIIVFLVMTFFRKERVVADSAAPRYAELVDIPGGTYPQSDGTQMYVHTVSAFKLGKYEVTYELWHMVYQWAIANGFSFENAGRQGGSVDGGAKMNAERFRPVTDINWRDAIVWCNAYSQKSGMTPVYYSDAAFKNIIMVSNNGKYISINDKSEGGFDKPYVKWNAAGYRLPTEGEWQYAASYIDGLVCTPDYCASGATEDCSDIIATGLVSWNANNSGNCTHGAGEKKPNALGLYDMSGNVWEWCWDWVEKYPGKSRDYRGPSDGNYRIIRGGSFFKKAEKMNIGLRILNVPPYYSSDDIGLRVARQDREKD